MNLKTKNNKNIYIFDNVFESHLAEKFYIFILNSFFKINFLSDSSVLDYHNKFSNSFGSSFSPDDVESLGFLKNLPDEIKNKFCLDRIEESWVKIEKFIGQDGKIYS